MDSNIRADNFEIVRHFATNSLLCCWLGSVAYLAIGAATLLSIIPPAGATATPDDTFMPYAGASVRYDDNLLRLSDQRTPQQAAGKNTKSDFIKQINAGLNIDWDFNRQNLVVKTNINQNWYTNYSELDNLGYDVLGQWNWAIGNKFKGDIGYSNRTSLGSFSQLNQLISNTQTIEKYFVNGAYQVIPDWFVHGGFARRELSFSEPTRQVSNNSEDTGEFGVRYLNNAKNMFGLKVSLTDGTYPKRNVTEVLDNAYTRNSYDFNWIWNYSIKTRFDGSLGYTHQNYDNLKTRDFSNMTAHGNIFWLVTGKTALYISGWREIAQAETLTSNFMLRQGARFTPSWMPTAKLKLSIPVSFELQDFLGDPGLDSNAAVDREDTVSNFGLNVGYKPLENTEASLMIQYEDRISNIQLRTYQDLLTGLNMKVNF